MTDCEMREFLALAKGIGKCQEKQGDVPVGTQGQLGNCLGFTLLKLPMIGKIVSD